MSRSAGFRDLSLPYLFLASVAALFLEMTLIRWISTEVRLFAYVQNLALIACFLGFGLGCYHADKKIRYWLGIASTLMLGVLVVLPFPLWRHFLIMISELLTLSPDAAMWSFLDPTGGSLGVGVVVALAVVCVFLALLIGAIFPLGQYIGKALDDSPKPIVAYSVNLAGSLLGTWLLAALSFQWTEPHLWLLFSFALVLSLLPQARRLIIPVLIVLLLIPLRWHRDISGGVVWSPYQKLSLMQKGPAHYELSVNNTGYMKLSGVQPGEDVSESSYDSPFRFIPGRDRVLIVGSGGGNDVAAALRNGVTHIDAVEIDPAILAFGKRYHPNHPYDSKAVSVYVNDARNFMRTTTARYDAIIFGLLDSHTVLSGQTNMRLDNYVYTDESFREAMRLLKPDGVMVLKFEVRSPWLWMGNRFASMLTDEAGRPPIVYYCPEVGILNQGSVFLTSNSNQLWERANTPALSEFLKKHPPVFDRTANAQVQGTSDDWPYIYHRSRTIPRTHLTIMVILMAMAAVLFGRKLKVKQSSTWHFLFLGAGFLCLETQLISRSALYFGNTWLVNCFGISMVLSVLLLANVFVERRQNIRLQTFFAILIASLLINYAFPWSSLPLGVTQIGLLLYLGYAIPLFCAGVIFAHSFRSYEHKSLALGANLFGATVGGMSQNLSFIFGLKSLLIVSAVFYVGAWIFSRSSVEVEIAPSVEKGLELVSP